MGYIGNQPAIGTYKKLDFDDKIIFEMENTSKNAIKGI